MNSLQVNIPISISPPQRSAGTTSSNASSYRKRMAAAMAIVGSLGRSLGNSLGRSFANSYGRSWGRTTEFPMQLISPQGGQTHHGSSSEQAYISGLEDRFCRDFVCCGLQLENLHDLLQHFEEYHVHVESDVDDDDDGEGLPFEFDSIDDMDTDMDDVYGGDSMSFSSSFLQTQSIALSEIYSARRIHSSSNNSTSTLTQHHTTHGSNQNMNHDDLISAFDTSVIRKQNGGHSHNSNHHATPQRSKRVNPPTFVVNDEPQTIPLAFDGPTRVITEKDELSMSLEPPTMSIHPSCSSTSGIMGSPFFSNSELGPSSYNDGHSSSASTVMTDGDDEKDDRPYKCKMPNCSKAYKNPGGLKYHLQHGHCDDGTESELSNMMSKPYQCTVPECGKRYKNLNGLKYHIEHAHVHLLGHHHHPQI